MESVDFDDVDNPYFAAWMEAWSRRVVIAKALAAVRRELAASRERMRSDNLHKPVLPTPDWTLPSGVGKDGLEMALLAMDVFPRAALVLTLLEGMAVADAAVLLDGSPGEVRKALAIGAQQLTASLARRYVGNCPPPGALAPLGAY